MFLKAPAAIVGVGTNPADGNHVRIGDPDGQLWESVNGGDSWSQISALPRQDNTLVYRFSFDPANINHIIAGRLAGGAYVTFDGGRNWSRTSFGNNYNVMNFAVSPADPNVIWAMAVEIQSGVHAMHRSTDGGRTFTQVVAESAEVEMQNGPVMAAHPTNPDILYYSHGVSDPEPITDLYRVEAGGNVTHTRNFLPGFNAIVFSPVDPMLMYLGLQAGRG